MTKRYTLELLAEDERLMDKPGDASFTMTSRIGNNDVEVSVFETLDETLAGDWRRILDDNGRAYVSRVLDANNVVHEQSVRSPTWGSA